MEGAYWKYQNGQVWASGITEYCLYKSSYFLKNSDCHKISFLNDGGLKLGHVDIFDTLFPFLKFAKLWPIIVWKVGHVMA